MHAGAALSRIAGALLALGCATAANATTPIVPPAEGGYAVPIYGAKEGIYDVYQAPDGHLVLEFIYQDQNGTEDDFYDTRTRQRLFPAQAYTLAHDNAVKAKLVSAAGLKKLQVNDLTAMPVGNLLLKITDHGPDCRPIPNFLTLSVEQAGRKPVEFALFAPTTNVWVRRCGQHFTFHYGLVGAGFYAVGLSGFFMNVYGYGCPFLIWLDWNGHSTFFNGRKDIVQVPFGDLGRALSNAERNSDGAPRELTAIVDATISRYAQAQMHRKAHG
jgi:hypothetical protein